MEDEQLDALTTTLDALNDNPYSIDLHKQSIKQTAALNLDVPQALQLCITNLAAPNSIWIPLLTTRREQLDLNDGEAVQELLGLFEAAEKDYLSIDILKMHMQFLVELAQMESSPVGEDEVRSEMRRLTRQGVLDVIRGNEVWEIMKNWELEIIQNASE
jgi:hypothetical protein